MARTLRPAAPVIVAGLLAAGGCQRPAPVVAPTRPPEVVVALPVTREVTDHEDFTGRTEAVATVEVRARVTGYLEKTHFQEGRDVKAGDLLFEIDPRTYAAEVERMRATLVQSEARHKRLIGDARRAENLLGRGAVGREEYDKIVGDRDEAAAAVGVAKAGLHLAELNLGFCKVTAPLDGRISRRLMDPGSLVQADETPLTTIVTLDPIYAYFDIDERTLLRLRRLVQAGKIPSARETEVRVQLGLADEEGFSLSGVIDFADNKLDPGTGTLRVRAKIENPKKLLSPGLFLRLRLPVGRPREALLVPEQALATDQGRKFLYALNDKDEVVYRPVKVGLLTEGMRVVEEGLKPGERVIVTGLQRVRPGVRVTPKDPGTRAGSAKPTAGAVAAKAAGGGVGGY